MSRGLSKRTNLELLLHHFQDITSFMKHVLFHSLTEKLEEVKLSEILGLHS